MVSKEILGMNKSFNKIAGGVVAADVLGVTLMQAIETARGSSFVIERTIDNLEGVVSTTMLAAIPIGMTLLSVLNEVPFEYARTDDYGRKFPQYKHTSDTRDMPWDECLLNGLLGAGVGCGMAYLAIQLGDYLSRFF